MPLVSNGAGWIRFAGPLAIRAKSHSFVIIERFQRNNLLDRLILICHKRGVTKDQAVTVTIQKPAFVNAFANLWPGLLLASTIAACGFGLRFAPGVSIFSPLILAIVIGIAFHNLVGTPARAKPGVAFSLRRILRFAIVLLGLQLNVEQMLAVGATGIAVIAVTLVATFAFTIWLGICSASSADLQN